MIPSKVNMVISMTWMVMVQFGNENKINKNQVYLLFDDIQGEIEDKVAILSKI
jgi:hypothetical protein